MDFVNKDIIAHWDQFQLLLQLLVKVEIALNLNIAKVEVQQVQNVQLVLIQMERGSSMWVIAINVLMPMFAIYWVHLMLTSKVALQVHIAQLEYPHWGQQLPVQLAVSALRFRANLRNVLQENIKIKLGKVPAKYVRLVYIVHTDHL